MNLFWILLLTLIILLTLYLILVFRKRKYKNLPPGPVGLPIIGYLPWINADKPFLTFENLSKKYGQICSVKLGKITTIVLSDAKIIRNAFARDVFSGRTDLYLSHGIMKGNGIICAQGERWRLQRQFLMRRLKDLGMVKYGPKRERMQKHILVGVENLLAILKENESTEFDATIALHHCIGNIMNSLVFGKTWELDDPEWNDICNRMHEGVKYMGMTGPVNFLPFLRFLPKYRKIENFLVDGMVGLHDIYKGIIAEVNTNFDPEKPADNLLWHFLREMKMRNEQDRIRDYFTLEQFCFFLADSFGAGTDTSVSTFNWFLLFISIHENLQDKISREIIEKCDDSSEFVTLKDAEDLQFLKACMAESSRLRPVTPLGIPHSPVEDTELNGYEIPRGSMVIPLLWGIHRDPECWVEPEKFMPERFLNEEGIFSKPPYFMPFQAGKRACVGEELARTMLLLFSANLFRNYAVSVRDKFDPTLLEGDCGFTYNPKNCTFLFVPKNTSDSPQ